MNLISTIIEFFASVCISVFFIPQTHAQNFTPIPKASIPGSSSVSVPAGQNLDQGQASCGEAARNATSVSMYTQICRSVCKFSDTSCIGGRGNFCLSQACKPIGCDDLEACSTAKPEAGACVDGNPRKADGTCPTSQASAPAAPSTPSAAKPAAKPGSTATTPKASTGNSSRDLETCQAAQQEATKCCNNPQSCMSSQSQQQLAQLNALSASGNQQGLKDYCNQMQSTGQLSSAQNESAGSICYKKYTACQSTCSGLANGSSASADLNSIAQQCGGFSSRVQAMGAQGLAGSNSNGAADVCQQAAMAQPQSAGATPTAAGTTPTTTNPNDPTGCQANPASAQCQTCTANPSDPSCGTSAQQGTSNFSAMSEEDKGKNDFDIPDVGSGSASPFNHDQQSGAPTKNGTVANNSDGGIPGAGGGSSSSASAGGGARGPSAGSPGYTTDILQGERSGGYSSGGSTDTNEGGGGFAGYGNGRAPSSSGGLDLRQYLPGAAKDPSKHTGGYNAQSLGINGKFVDIWQKVSARFQEKCRLGQLIGCE